MQKYIKFNFKIKRNKTGYTFLVYAFICVLISYCEEYKKNEKVI